MFALDNMWGDLEKALGKKRMKIHHDGRKEMIVCILGNVKDPTQIIHKVELCLHKAVTSVFCRIAGVVSSEKKLNSLQCSLDFTMYYYIL